MTLTVMTMLPKNLQMEHLNSQGLPGSLQMEHLDSRGAPGSLQMEHLDPRGAPGIFQTEHLDQPRTPKDHKPQQAGGRSLAVPLEQAIRADAPRGPGRAAERPHTP